MGPILEEIGEEFKEKLDVYKIDVDENPEISNTFGIRSIPAILFIPVDSQPEMSVGAMSKASFLKTIEEILKIK